VCGLFASVGFAPDPARIDMAAHRGPDGRGWRVFDSPAGPVALGHRRLSIIDLDERAAQPMPSVDGRLWLIFNGEIYNYLELREELKAQGVRFRTQSDAEALLEAYARWGEAALDKLVGMFAFLIFDDRDKKLFAARDRFGIKPLYYVATPHGVAFASEIKQLLGLPGVERRINLRRADDYLSAGLTDHAEDTLFDGVRQLRAGECALLDLSGGRTEQPKVRRYYEAPREKGPALSERDAAARFKELFEQSVALHLRADVRVGSCLSGGLDSSSIVCVMDRLLKKQGATEPIHTVSACYSEKEVDEKPFMDAVTAETHTAPHYVYPKPEDAFALAETITWHQDEPFGSTSVYSQWRVFEEAKARRVKVMLDGQGADEQLAGYHLSFLTYAQSLADRGDGVALARLIMERWRSHGVSPAGQLKSLIAPHAPSWLKAGIKEAIGADGPGAGWMRTALLDGAREAGGAIAATMRREGVASLDTIGELCLLLVKGTSLPMLLRFEDRNSMAHSIEARVPFLDHRLVEFTLRLWDEHKIVGAETKRVLREAMRGVLPEKVRTRRDKLGFATPESAWFRGPLRPLVIDGVEATLARYPDLLDPKETRALMTAALDGRRPLDFTLWRIINFGVWGKVHGMTL
jgi:asparagine synthase (glutamine-hydrolysing)